MTTHDLTLWGVGTPRTMRACWTLVEFGLDYDRRPITSRSGETRTPEYLALNPKHKIPTLQHGALTSARRLAEGTQNAAAAGANKVVSAAIAVPQST